MCNVSATASSRESGGSSGYGHGSAQQGGLPDSSPLVLLKRHRCSCQMANFLSHRILGIWKVVGYGKAVVATTDWVFVQVVLRVAPADVFWSHSTPSFSSPYSRFQYLNLHAYGKTGCILAHLFPPASLAIDSLSDEEVSRKIFTRSSLVG